MRFYNHKKGRKKEKGRKAGKEGNARDIKGKNRKKEEGKVRKGRKEGAGKK